MPHTPVLALLGVALAAPLAGQQPSVLTEAPARQELQQVRVTARIVTVDREAFTRAGLSYVVLGNDRVQVSATGRRSSGGALVKVGTHGVTAFLEAARENRWIRSESTQQVLALSGRPARISSMDLSVDRRSARRQGPSLEVIPTVLGDGTVHLGVSASVEDRVTYARGFGLDGSPAAVETELLARDGEEILLGSSSSVQTTRESGLLAWGTGEQGRDVLVALTADVLTR